MFYRSNRPIVDSMRLGIHGRYVRFKYTADNQVQSVAEPLLSPDSVLYDALGNTTKTWSPAGLSASAPYFTEFIKDAIGRDTLVKSPISGDTIGTTRFTYDAADRVIGTVSYGPPRPYSLPLNTSFSPDTAQVVALTRTDSSAYDNEGNLTFKRSLSSSGEIQLSENLTYDAAGRLVRRTIGTGADSLLYDPAGNVVSARQRSGKWVNQSYDVLNRLTTRIIPDTIHVKDANPCSGLLAGPLGTTSSCFMVFPYFPNSGNNFLIAADTSRFVYDAFGNMTQANNRYARVRRTYYRNGALKTDTLGVGRYALPLVDSIVTGQQYSYDLSGQHDAGK
jgi:YD repeat-containing protein